MSYLVTEGRCLGVKWGFLSVLVLVFINGCGPIYETRYNFAPPKEPHAQACLFQCQNGKMQCEQLEQMRVERCEWQAQYEQDRCERQHRRKGKEPKWYECGTTSCSADNERCEANYRSCYAACGGTVTSQEVCVMNCSELPDNK